MSPGIALIVIGILTAVFFSPPIGLLLVLVGAIIMLVR